ncbi:hypothetical protein KAR91_67370 [Candidatus Pacearchaeota archaeon]|nr:hypothetical protein [Candidatus Pacearchaeota archaeon]
MNNNWIEEAIEPTRQKTERPYETLKRTWINTVETLIKNGLKSCEEVQATVYGHMITDEATFRIHPLVELWIDEYFEGLEE